LIGLIIFVLVCSFAGRIQASHQGLSSMKQFSGLDILDFDCLSWAIQDSYYQHLMILVLMWVAIGSGWNLISGFTGQVLSAPRVLGTGAYTAALLLNKLIFPWWAFWSSRSYWPCP
jgi:ABC-type branched-subunit amino acid transport system permease subunit